MAAQYLDFDKTAEPMRQAIQGLRQVREGRAALANARAIMVQMVDGATSAAANFDLFATECGFQAGDYADANTAAKASFDEIDSLHAKLFATGSTSEVDQAITQCCAKHGV